jgi:hypothetical protein
MTFADGYRLTIAVASRHTSEVGSGSDIQLSFLSCFGTDRQFYARPASWARYQLSTSGALRS